MDTQLAIQALQLLIDGNASEIAGRTKTNEALTIAVKQLEATLVTQLDELEVKKAEVVARDISIEELKKQLLDAGVEPVPAEIIIKP